MGTTTTEMRQVAPYPQILASLVERLRYRRDLGWKVWLEDDLQRDKPGRHIGESRGMTLVVQRCGRDTYHPADPDLVEDALAAVAKAPDDLAALHALRALAEAVREERYQVITVNHYFPVPAATYNLESWRRWLLDRLGDVDTHERMEDFAFVAERYWITAPGEDPPSGEELERPYAPVHKPGWDPYMITVLSTAEDRDTDFRGNRVHPDTAASPESG
jgi:hypothetical protein